jgi:ferrochelatase
MPIDVLMLQLGTPDAPTTKALKPYLREFLSDSRVIEGPAWLRWLLVNLIIVPFRSSKSAAKYQRIWDEKSGSPLLSITQSQRDRLQERLGNQYRVTFGMRYGRPSVPDVIAELMKNRCERLILLPMYPQYSATTTASSFDAVFDALKTHRVVPSVRAIAEYHADPQYIEVTARRIERYIENASKSGKPPEMFLLSFHGIPIDYIKRGDPYMRQSAATAKLVAKRMGWKKGDWKLVFQSRLGRQKWLTPYTDVTLMELGRQGFKRVLISQPGFTADCLETIDEIGHEGLEEFRSTGGEDLIRVPCYNDEPEFIDMLAQLVERESHGWK